MIVVVGLGSATQQDPLRHHVAFGGDCNDPQGRPPHACSGYGMGMGVMLGVIAAVLICIVVGVVLMLMLRTPAKATRLPPDFCCRVWRRSASCSASDGARHRPPP